MIFEHLKSGVYLLILRVISTTRTMCNSKGTNVVPLLLLLSAVLVENAPRKVQHDQKDMESDERNPSQP